jgi:hypothetical protein
MNLLRWVDEQVIDRVYQPTVNRLQVEIQEVCRFCLTGAISSVACGALIQVEASRWTDVVVRAAGVTFACVVYSRLPSFDSSRVNPYRVVPTFVALRYFVVIMGAIEIYLLVCRPSLLHLIDLIGSIVNTCFWYFVACTKPPPRKRWVQEQAFARAY